jgi:hypothetical protein
MGDQAQQMQGLIRIYDLTTGKYDVTCEAGPSFTTKREEAAAQMVEFIRAYPNAAPLIGDLLAKNLDWPGADDIAERLKAMLPPAGHRAEPASSTAATANAATGRPGESRRLASLQQELQNIKASKDNEQRKLLIDCLPC